MPLLATICCYKDRQRGKLNTTCTDRGGETVRLIQSSSQVEGGDEAARLLGLCKLEGKLTLLNIREPINMMKGQILYQQRQHAPGLALGCKVHVEIIAQLLPCSLVKLSDATLARL